MPVRHSTRDADRAAPSWTSSEYSLTPRGTALNEALEPLGAWGRANVLGPSEGSAAAGEVGVDDDVALVAGGA